MQARRQMPRDCRVQPLKLRRRPPPRRCPAQRSSPVVSFAIVVLNDSAFWARTGIPSVRGISLDGCLYFSAGDTKRDEVTHENAMEAALDACKQNAKACGGTRCLFLVAKPEKKHAVRRSVGPPGHDPDAFDLPPRPVVCPIPAFVGDALRADGQGAALQKDQNREQCRSEEKKAPQAQGYERPVAAVRRRSGKDHGGGAAGERRECDGQRDHVRSAGRTSLHGAGLNRSLCGVSGLLSGVRLRPDAVVGIEPECLVNLMGCGVQAADISDADAVLIT